MKQMILDQAPPSSVPCKVITAINRSDPNQAQSIFAVEVGPKGDIAKLDQ